MAFLIHDLLRQSAKRNPDALALLGPKEEMSYGELDARSDALARVLVARGVKPGMPVGIAMHKCVDAIVGVYGILKAGAAYVPIDAFAPASRGAAIVANTQLAYLLTTDDRVGSLVSEMRACDEGASLACVVTPGAVDSDALAGLAHARFDEASDAPLPAITDTHLAYVLHTSGSTGVPKGVAISHRNALCFVDSASEFWDITASDRLCSQAPLHFDLSVFDLYCAAWAGAAVVFIPEFYAAFPKKIAATIDSQGITVWNSVVSTLTLMMERGKPESHSFDTLRAVIFSGEVMPPRHLRTLHQHMAKAVFYNVYGQTEANSSMYYRVDRKALESDQLGDDWKVPLGRELPNFEVFALDAEGKRVTEPGVAGELYVRAHTVAMGYWGKPELSAEKFLVDPIDVASGARVYRTGDRVTLDADGNYLFAGRTDDMIKVRGYRVELGEIDTALLAVDGVESAVCVAVPDEEAGYRLIAFATLAEGADLGSEDILRHCQDRLPKYMLPEALHLRSDMPRTSTNKIDRNALRALLEA